MIKSIEPFWFIVKDDERREFSVVGPITDDSGWTERVARAQDAGRRVRCETGHQRRTRDQVIDSVTKSLGLKYVDQVDLGWPDDLP